MSDQLPPHELELMNLFDRDLNQEQRDRLIELLSSYPELSEKYAFYLHLQDLELSEMPEPDPMVRKRLVRLAVQQTHKIRFAAKAQAFINALTQPLFAAPAALCLVFLIGYELLDSSQPAPNSLLSSQVEGTNLAEEQDEVEPYEDVSNMVTKAPSKNGSVSTAKRAKQLDTQAASKKEGRLETARGAKGNLEPVAAKENEASSKAPPPRIAMIGTGSPKAESTPKTRGVRPQAARSRSQNDEVKQQELIKSLSRTPEQTERLGDIFGDFESQGNRGALIGSGSGSGQGKIGVVGSSDVGGDGMSARQTKVRRAGKRNTRSRKARKRSEPQIKSRKRSPPTQPRGFEEPEVKAQPERSGDTLPPPTRDDVALALGSKDSVENEHQLETAQPRSTSMGKSSSKARGVNIRKSANRPLSQTERVKLQRAKRDLKLRSGESVTILRLARLALRANDLEQARTWTEWVIRRNDSSLRAALELQRLLKRLQERTERRE